jgi:hypothetical protein
MQILEVNAENWVNDKVQAIVNDDGSVEMYGETFMFVPNKCMEDPTITEGKYGMTMYDVVSDNWNHPLCTVYKFNDEPVWRSEVYDIGRTGKTKEEVLAKIIAMIL